MFRKFIKAIIPNKGEIFFSLFEAAALNAHDAASVLVDILNAKDDQVLKQLRLKSKLAKQKADNVNKQVLHALNNMLITPIDRGDIQELSTLFNKLTKRVVKISTKLDIYNIDAQTDDCLIKNASTLLIIADALVECVKALKASDGDRIIVSGDKINDLEENGIEDFRHAIDEIYSGKFDTLTILKLKEIYKSIDAAIELSVSAAELIVQVSLKSI